MRLALVLLAAALPSCLASVPSHAYDQLLTMAQVSSGRQAPRKPTAAAAAAAAALRAHFAGC